MTEQPSVSQDNQQDNQAPDTVLLARQLRRRNIAVLMILLACVGLFFSVTIIKLAVNSPKPAAAPEGGAR